MFFYFIYCGNKKSITIGILLCLVISGYSQSDISMHTIRGVSDAFSDKYSYKLLNVRSIDEEYELIYTRTRNSLMYSFNQPVNPLHFEEPFRLKFNTSNYQLIGMQIPDLKDFKKNEGIYQTQLVKFEVEPGVGYKFFYVCVKKKSVSTGYIDS
jgi:hypothetical protein